MWVCPSLASGLIRRTWNPWWYKQKLDFWRVLHNTLGIHTIYQIGISHIQAIYGLTGILVETWHCVIPMYPVCKGTTHECGKVVPIELGILHSPSLSLNDWNLVCSSSPKLLTVVLNWIVMGIFWLKIQYPGIAQNLVKAWSWFSTC